jgi:VTC domain-containing protein
MMRLPVLMAALVGALFLGTATAHADPGFVLTESQARSGDKVHFSISGLEDEASYVLEIGDEQVAEDSEVSSGQAAGEFTMPDLGSAGRSVTVEAQIKQGDETTNLTRSLQYLAGSQSSDPATPQSAAAVTAAPAAPSSPARTVSSAQQPRRAASRTRGRKRVHSYRRVRRRHLAVRRVSPRHTAQAGDGGRKRAVSASRRRTRAPGVSRPGRAEQGPASVTPSGQHQQRGRGESATRSAATHLATILTAPTTGIFSLAAEAPGGGSAGFPAMSLIILPLLCLAALILAGAGFAPPRRPRRPASFGFVHDSRRSRRDTHKPASWKRRTQATLPSPTSLDQAIAPFAPISLAAVDQRAGLATRNESKYILEPGIFESLIAELPADYQILEIDGERVFRYDSIYFDTPEYTVYRHHVQGRRKRFKCRTRLYSTDGPCFFEVKMKGGRGATIKRRIELEIEEHGLLTAPALAFLERELSQAYGTPPPAALAPGLRTHYRRLTLVSRRGTERLTFDLELMFALDGAKHSIQPGRILLETKSGTGSSRVNGNTADASMGGGDVAKALHRLGVRPVKSCSKYCIGVALADPALRDNPFRRLIRQYFDSPRHVRPSAPEYEETAQPLAGFEEVPGPIGSGSPTLQGVLAMLNRRNGA